MSALGELELFARCAAGFESVLTDELRALGAKRVRPLKGGASFSGTLEVAYRTCLWSRVATRIQLVLARIDCHDAEALYQGVYDFPWEEHLVPGATVAVQAHGSNANLRNSQFSALKAKDALCDRMREVHGTRPDVDAKDPDFSLDISVHERKATLYLNLSGQSLHRRGYREAGVQTEAPLKETLAAAILLAARWDTLAREGAVFADPMCGSGTLAIEAALIAAGIAPGALRTRWGFLGWSQHDDALWRAVRDEAVPPETTLRKSRQRIVAGDLDPHALDIARANAQRAGVDGLIRFELADASTLGARLVNLGAGAVPPTGLVATNPPYGHRLQSSEQLPKTYAALARATSNLSRGWQLAIITPDPAVDTALGQTAQRIIQCFNGPIKTTLRIYELTNSARNELQVVSLSGRTSLVPVAESQSEQFAARLRKVARERAKWARRAGVSCYRLYDADLPDYAFSVDLYSGTGPDSGLRFARVEEHRAPSSVDADRAARRLADAKVIVCAVLDIDATHVFVQACTPDGAQSTPPTRTPVRVDESGYAFSVNLSARHDTGLPLEHRETRKLLAAMAQGARFLSLGAHGGAPALYAAGGGARQTTTVDPATPFLDDARSLLCAQGFSGPNHRFVRADILSWLSDHARANESFDLIYLDFIALAGTHAGHGPFDAKRDHVACLRLVANALSGSGTLVLTSGLRTFRLDEDALGAAGLRVRDITAQTIPHDFARTPKIHQCWLISRA